MATLRHTLSTSRTGPDWRVPDFLQRGMGHETDRSRIRHDSSVIGVQEFDSVRFLFNDDVDLTRFDALQQSPDSRAVSVRYMEDTQGKHLSGEVAATQSLAKRWLPAGGTHLVDPGTYVWQNSTTLLWAPPESGWTMNSYVRFEFHQQLTNDAGNAFAQNSGRVVIAYITAPSPPPKPFFRMTSKIQEHDVSIDERSATLELELTASGINPVTHYLDEVSLLIDRAHLPKNVSVDTAAASEGTVWHVIGPGRTMRGDGDSTTFRCEIETGLFHHLRQHSKQSAAPVPLSHHSLNRYPPAVPGPVRLDAQVQCIVREVGSPLEQLHSVNPVGFEIAVD